MKIIPRRRHKHWLTPFATLLFICLSTMVYRPVQADEIINAGTEKIRINVLTDKLNAPWSMAFLPDGRILVTEKSGQLRMIENGKLLPQAIAGAPKVVDSGQGGLLDVALHPQYAQNGWLYLSYSARGTDGVGTEVMRAKLQGMSLTASEIVFSQTPKISGGNHFGSRIVFDDKGHVYLTLGDRGDMPRAQKLDDHAGSVIRLHDDGRVPRDNPFVGRAGAKPEKFTLGNRNMQGAAMHPQTGELWTHEHGPQGGDEINIMRAGRNYGWPVITYGVNYGFGTKIGEGSAKPGMEQPLHVWVPSIAPSGMAFYTGDKFPNWKGNLLVGALRDEMLVRLELNGEKVVREERMLKDQIGRIRDVRVGPDGLVYLLTDERDGVVVRLEPQSSLARAK